MARPVKDGLPQWRPKRATIKKFNSDDFKERYNALRSSSSNFIRRRDVRNYILNKYNNKCYICGSSECLQIDHITSVYRFAVEQIGLSKLNSEENLAAICRKCNSGKSPNK